MQGTNLHCIFIQGNSHDYIGIVTSETKKAGSDREAPVNHIGYLQTFINKTHVVTSVIAL